MGSAVDAVKRAGGGKPVANDDLGDALMPTYLGRLSRGSRIIDIRPAAVRRVLNASNLIRSLG